MYHVWITVILPFDEGKFISHMVQKSYDISPAAEDKQLMLSRENSANGIIACKVEKPDISFRAVYDEIADVLVNNKFSYHSLVISEFSASSIWSSGNINTEKLIQTSLKKVVN